LDIYIWICVFNLCKENVSIVSVSFLDERIRGTVARNVTERVTFSHFFSFGVQGRDRTCPERVRTYPCFT
jgi:hypothetical protein